MYVWEVNQVPGTHSLFVEESDSDFHETDDTYDSVLQFFEGGKEKKCNKMFAKNKHKW